MENINTLFEIFSWGVDYGQFLSEKERESEEWADAFNGCVFARKYSMPSQPIERRQIHSEKWLKVKKSGLSNFFDFINGKVVLK